MTLGRAQWWLCAGVAAAGLALFGGAGSAAAETSGTGTSESADSAESSNSTDQESNSDARTDVPAERTQDDDTATPVSSKRPSHRTYESEDADEPAREFGVSRAEAAEVDNDPDDDAPRPTDGFGVSRAEAAEVAKDPDGDDPRPADDNEPADDEKAPVGLKRSDDGMTAAPPVIRREQVAAVVLPPARPLSQPELLIRAVTSAVVRLLFGGGDSAAPAGVTVGHSSLELADDVTVNADWYYPSETEPVGVIYLQHGFFRSNANVSALAGALARDTNSIVVAPALSSNFLGTNPYWINGESAQRAVADLFAGDRTALNASAAAAGYTGDLPQHYVLAGHSAGGNLVTAAGGYIGRDPNLKGIVLLDAVDRDGDMAEGLRALSPEVPVYQIAAEPSSANAYGSGANVLVGERPGEFVGVRIAGGSHVDAEGASSDLLGGLVAGFSQPGNAAAVPIIAAGWINDMFGGTHNGLYPKAGGSATVGGATVLALSNSLRSEERVAQRWALL